MYVVPDSEVLIILQIATLSVTVSFAFLGKMLLVFALIYIMAELTPKIAKKIDSKAPNKKDDDPRLYSVRSAFEPREDDEKPNKTLFPELKELKQKIDNNKK